METIATVSLPIIALLFSGSGANVVRREVIEVILSRVFPPSRAAQSSKLGRIGRPVGSDWEPGDPGIRDVLSCVF